jgi:hypothetical protein
MPMTDSFEQFKDHLGQKLDVAHRMGASRGTVLNAAKDFAEWLSQAVDPNNPEQRLLKEMWSVADENEKNAMVNVLVKFMDREGPSAQRGGQDAVH